MFSLLALLGTSFALGAFHALEPGHGKTMVAAYLVGSRGRWFHAVHLGIVVTITHTLGILLLGLISVLGLQHVDSHQVERWLQLIAGAIVLGVGVWLFWRQARGGGHHHHHPPGHHHHHEPGDDHHRAAGHDHDHHDHQPTSAHPTQDTSRRHLHAPPSVWSLTALGISGGLVPCPAALAPLLYGIGQGQAWQGFWAVVAFSVGLALVLVAIGLAVVRARALVDRHFSQARWLHWLPLASAVIVTGFGFLLIMRGWLAPAHLH